MAALCNKQHNYTVYCSLAIAMEQEGSSLLCDLEDCCFLGKPVGEREREQVREKETEAQRTERARDTEREREKWRERERWRTGEREVMILGVLAGVLLSRLVICFYLGKGGLLSLVCPLKEQRGQRS